MPRWILAGMPAFVAALCLGRGVGGVVLLLWLILGISGKQPQYPYPRKSRPYASRLFFAFSGGLFVLMRFGERNFIAYPGIAALSAMVTCVLWQWPWRRKWQWIAGSIFLIIACM